MLRMLILSVILLYLNSNLFAQNPFVNVLNLNGNQQYFEIPDAPYLNLDTTRDFTIELMFKLNSLTPFMLVNKMYVDLNHAIHSWFALNGWWIDINGEKPFGPEYGYFDVDTLPGAVRTGMGGITYIGSTGGEYTFVEGKWHHFAVTIEKSGHYKLYIDGEIESGCWLYDFTTDLSTPGIPFNVGGWPPEIDNTVEISFYFNGHIDEVRIWNDARTESQIQSTMSDTLSSDYYAQPDSGLEAYFRFDQMENLGIGDDDLADDIRDLSFNANHGDIIGEANLVPSNYAVSLESNDFEIPVTYKLLQNYPNPFNPTTTIEFNLPKSEYTTLKVFNTIGQEAVTLISKKLNQGNHTYIFNGKNLASGVYYYQLVAGDCRELKKMILLK